MLFYREEHILVNVCNKFSLSASMIDIADLVLGESVDCIIVEHFSIDNETNHSLLHRHFILYLTSFPYIRWGS